MSGATEGGNYVSSGPPSETPGITTAASFLTPNPNWYGDVKPTLTELHLRLFIHPAAAQNA